MSVSYTAEAGMTPATVVREEEMFRLFTQGLSVREVAEHMGMSYPTIARYIKRAGFQQRLREYNGIVWEKVDEEIRGGKLSDITARLEEGAEEALDTMIRLAKGGSTESIKLKASQDLLDRSARTSKVKTDTGSHQMPQINIAVLQQAARVVEEETQFFKQRAAMDQRLIDAPVVTDKVS
jgi:predicted transcriptional regulator